jgi:site-specific DNA recombinase
MVILLSFSAIFCSLSHIRREKTARSITNCNTSNQIRCWGGKIEKLNKHLSAEERAMIMLMKRDESGCRVISITQQTSDDPAGEMASKMFSLFDEYSSKENGKHTLRAMKENARRGFFNGSRPCFGYRAVECYMDGDNTRKKKRAEIDPSESAIVRNIFDYYLNGHQGCVMGAREIALHLNTKGISLRGNVWNKSRVHEVLSNRAYIGEYYFNKRDHKTKTLKAESEWILLTVEPIIDEAVFESVRIKRESRAPAKISPRLVTSPILLTGLLKCGCCGAGITTATGKGGLYRYYKCNTRVNQGASYGQIWCMADL